MKAQGRSWRYFGLIALALAAGAVRMEEELIEPATVDFHAIRNDVALDPVRCDERLDAAWLGHCTRPEIARVRAN